MKNCGGIEGLIEKADGLREKAKYGESLKLYKRALSLSKRKGDPEAVLISVIAVSDVNRMTGNFEAAVKHYGEAIDMCQALETPLVEADCMVGMGLSLRALGLWKEAVKFMTAARKVYRRAKDKSGTAFSIWAEAGALRVEGNISGAIRKFQEAHALFSSIKFKSGMAYSLCGLGGSHRMAGLYKESFNYYTRANRMFRELKDRFGTAYSHCGMGNAFRMTGNYHEAIKHFRQAGRLYEDIGDIVSYSYTLWSFANVYKMKGDLSPAREFLKKAQINFKKTRDPRGIIYCDLTLGEMEYMKGKSGRAEKLFRLALKEAVARGFKLETCHARMLLAVMAGGPSKTLSCYGRLGVRTMPSGIPCNMP